MYAFLTYIIILTVSKHFTLQRYWKSFLLFQKIIARFRTKYKEFP